MISPHPTNDALESYIMGRLAEQDLTHLEEHLLICSRCQDAVQEIEAFVTAAKAATQTLQQTTRSPRWSVSRAPVPYAVAACAAIVSLFLAIPTSHPSPETIQLASMRGSEASAFQGHAGVPLNLKLDISEVPVAASYTVELVDANGGVQWQRGEVARGSGILTALVSTRLSPGQYWVRVYRNTPKSDLLREFNLSLN